MPEHTINSGDNPELEALFDSVASSNKAATVSAAPIATHPSKAADHDAEEALNPMYEQIGQLTRKMHNALRNLGYDKSLERVANVIPDAKDRLAYIATLTEQSAERVLNATDLARPYQEQLEAQAKLLSERWNRLYDNLLSVDEFRVLVEETRNYLNDIPAQTQATNTQLLEIMMAQDFQDLTGQVIKKMMEVVKVLETELVQFLIEFSPQEKKAELNTSLLNGPVVNPKDRTDIVTAQQQVDDLLESLGF